MKKVVEENEVFVIKSFGLYPNVLSKLFRKTPGELGLLLASSVAHSP